MTTRHLISLVTGVLFLSILAPVGLSLWLAHRQVETKFIDELDMFSTRVALRTERVGEQAKKALRHIEAFQGVPCSDEHLLEMRRLSYSYRYIQEVLYLKDNVPQCSSLEKRSQADAFPPAMKVTPDGYRAWLTTQNDLGIKRFMAALGSEHYVVMVDPGSFIDVIPFGSWPIEVTIIGTVRNVVVASSADLPSDVLQHVQQEKSITHFKKDGSIYNARPFPELGITIVTWASTLPLQNLAPAGTDLAPGRHSYRLAHRRLCFAYFAPLTVAPSPITGRYPASGHQSPLPTNYLAQNGESGWSRGAGSLAAGRRKLSVAGSFRRAGA